MYRDFHFVRGGDIVRDDLVQIIELNRVVYGEDSTVPLSLLEAVHKKNSNVAVIAKDTAGERVIGYMSGLPLADDPFKNVMSVDFAETFGPEDVIAYDFSRHEARYHHLYLASIVVTPDLQNQGIFRALFSQFLRLLIDLAKDHQIYFEDIAARALPKGEKLCVAVGMEHLATSPRGEKIFYAKWPPPLLSSVSATGKELVDLYAEVPLTRTMPARG